LGANEKHGNLSQGSRFLGRDLNPGRPEYKAGVSTTRPRRSVVKSSNSLAVKLEIGKCPFLNVIAVKHIFPLRKESRLTGAQLKLVACSQRSMHTILEHLQLVHHFIGWSSQVCFLYQKLYIENFSKIHSNFKSQHENTIGFSFSS
jgi:hypothetical protein